MGGKGMVKQSYDDWEREQYQKHGWIAHLVLPDDETGMANYHTHGLAMDLQIVLPICPDLAKNLLQAAVDLLKSGTELLHGVDYSRIVDGYSVRFVRAIESGRPVLRMIIPNSDGKLDRDQMAGLFATQWEGVQEE